MLQKCKINLKNHETKTAKTASLKGKKTKNVIFRRYAKY